MTTNRNHELYTKRETARILRLSLRSIDNLLKSRELDYLKIRRAVRIPREAVERFKAAHTVKAHA